MFRFDEMQPRKMRGVASFFTVTLIISLLMFFSFQTVVLAGKFETPRNRKVTDILPDSMISGSHYKIQKKVVSYGYMHHYTVNSQYGVFEITGDMALRKLLKEIQAIAELKKVTEAEAFVKSVGGAVKKHLYIAKGLITEPVDTVSGIPKGVYKLFGNIGTGISKKHDPSEDARHKQILQVSSYKREYTYKLGVDVYSSNKVLQEELNKVGWAAAIGSLSVSAVTAGAGSTTVSVIGNLRLAKSVNEVIRAEPPSRLRLINDEKLNDMGVPKSLRERFLDHPHFTPRHDTIIVECLMNLTNALGRGMFLNFALQADDEESANFIQLIAATMLGYHVTVSPILEIRVIGGIVVARAKNESGLIPFPLDHGVWTEQTARILENLSERYRALGLSGKLELWVTGTLSPMARQEIKKLGIVVSENVVKKKGFME